MKRYTPEEVGKAFEPMLNEFFWGGIFAKLRASAFTLVLIDKYKIDPWLALQVGCSLLLDKPLYILADKSCPIPARLAQLADGVFYADTSDHLDLERATRELVEMARRPKKTEGRIQ